jgi:HTH-type transcriptional regulator/antitoxin HigA
MEDLNLSQSDLIDAIGDKGTVSKVLNKKISLSLRMIRNLSVLLKLPPEILIQEVDKKAA